MVSHSTQWIWKCLCVKHMGHTLLGVVLLGPLCWESMLWRKGFPARQVFMHNLMLKWEFGTAWGTEEYDVSAADSQMCPQAKFTQRHIQSEFAYPENVLPPAPSMKEESLTGVNLPLNETHASKLLRSCFENLSLKVLVLTKITAVLQQTHFQSLRRATE